MSSEENTKKELAKTTTEHINKINKILMILNQDFKDDTKKLINYVEEISQLYSEQEPSDDQGLVAEDEAKDNPPNMPDTEDEEGEDEEGEDEEDQGEKEEELITRSTLIKTNPTQIEPKLNLLQGRKKKTFPPLGEY